jgi:hypothetical protein
MAIVAFRADSRWISADKRVASMAASRALTFSGDNVLVTLRALLDNVNRFA